MGRKISKDEWIARFKDIHGDSYSYENFVSMGGQIASEAFCKAHGTFSIVPVVHAKGAGCPQCRKAKARLETEKKILADIKSLYGDSIKVIKLNAKGKSVFECIHGQFEAHLSNLRKAKGTGCPRCVGGKKIKRISSEILERFTKAHGDLYDYSLVNYVNSSTKVTIICRDHGPWETLPGNHWSSRSGCPRCFGESRSEKLWLEALEKEIGYLCEKQVLITSDKKRGVFKIDGVFKNVAVEYDGFYWHKNNQERDERKQALIQQQGLKVIRLREGLPPLKGCKNFTVSAEPEISLIKEIVQTINILNKR